MICSFDPSGTTLFIADTGNNRIVRLKLSRNDTPEAVWQQMQACMAAQDVEGAITCFAESVQVAHRSYFRSYGSQKSASIVAGASQISPIFISKDEAEYSINETMAGRVISFPVWFIRKNGLWKIQEF